MEKARLTKVQAKLVGEAMEHNDVKLNGLVERHATGTWNTYYEELNELDIDTFCRALYVGYEIVEEDQTVVVTEKMRNMISISYNDDIGNEPVDKAYKEGVRMVLERLGIIIDGIN